MAFWKYSCKSCTEGRYLTRLKKVGDAVESSDIIPAGTRLRVVVCGKGYYKDESINTTYDVVQASLSGCTVKHTPSFYSFTGNAIKPNKTQVKLYYKGKEIDSSDYRIIGYANNTNAGTAKVNLGGAGNFGGNKSASFKIIKLDWSLLF